MKFYHPPFKDPANPGCDLELCDYLRPLPSLDVLHFGTGSHHVVGKLGLHQVLGITKCIEEHEDYARLLRERPDLVPLYRILVTDIYTLTARSLPKFDLVTLFHLCEYRHDSMECGYRIFTDDEVLDQMRQTLRPNGRLAFFTGSNGWGQTEKLLHLFNNLERCEQFGRLVFYRSTK